MTIGVTWHLTVFSRSDGLWLAAASLCRHFSVALSAPAAGLTRPPSLCQRLPPAALMRGFGFQAEALGPVTAVSERRRGARRWLSGAA